MNERITRRRIAGVTSLTALLLSIAVPASAHVFIVESDVVGGGHGTEITLRVPHGCDGAATDSIEIQIPAGVTSVKPKLMAGWTIDVVSTAPVLPSIAPGASFSDEEMDAMTAPIVSSIKWSAGSLPDSEYADFQFSAVLPEAPGVVSFPAVQHCGDAEVAWIEVPAAGQDPETLEHPAPSVTVIAPMTGPAPSPAAPAP